jgi:hypothetical protein
VRVDIKAHPGQFQEATYGAVPSPVTLVGGGALMLAALYLRSYAKFPWPEIVVAVAQIATLFCAMPQSWRTKMRDDQQTTASDMELTQKREAELKKKLLGDTEAGDTEPGEGTAP